MNLLIKGLILSICLGFVSEVEGQRLNQDQDFKAAFNEATKSFLFGKYVQAVNLYKECLRVKPQSSAAHFQLSKVYLSAGNLQLAREHAKKAISYEEGNKWYLQSLGDIYQMEEKVDSAILMYEKLLAIDHYNVNVMFGIASLYEKVKKYEKSLEYLNRIDEQIGQSKEVAMTRYRLYEAMNQPEKAIGELKAAAMLSPGEYAINGMIAEYYQRHNNPDSAGLYYSQIFPEYGSDPNVVFSYANFLLETGKTDSAKILLLDVMNDSLVDHITKTGYFYNVLRDEQNFKIATPVIDTVTRALLKNHESDIRALSIYADVFLRLHKYNEAAWALTRITDINPSNYVAIEQLIYSLNILGKTDSVLLFAAKAMKLQPEKPVIYLFTGSAYYQKKDYLNAIRDLNRGLSLTEEKPLKLEFYSLLAECYQETGKYEESELSFKNALLIDKDNTAIKNNYAYYLSLREKYLKQALKMSKTTIEAEPENSTYLDTYAWILFKMGKVSKARKHILKALENGGGENEEILSHSAEIHIKLREYSEAVKYLEKIIAMPDKVQATKAQDRIREINSMLNK
ncbi:MAG TPA: DUF2225 domain-containing protein [Bacteroidales bacterium]|nr:DUF2225 domain-containing protein [Bacteroidales bacterium]